MSKKTTIINFAIFLFFPFLILNANAEEHYSTLPQAQYVTPQTVKAWQKEGKKLILVDVREPSEYKAGHLEGAINIRYLEVEKKAKAQKFDQKQPYIFYCTYSAWRAPYSANSMVDAGYHNAYILEGGIAAWKSGGQVIYATNPSAVGKVIPYPEALAKVLYHPKDREYRKKIYLTRKQLSDFDGQDGRPAYVAVNGTIYDLTQSRLWRGGVHAPSHGRARAGQDLSELIKESPHGDKHLKDFPVVGYLVEIEHN